MDSPSYYSKTPYSWRSKQAGSPKRVNQDVLHTYLMQPPMKLPYTYSRQYLKNNQSARSLEKSRIKDSSLLHQQSDQSCEFVCKKAAIKISQNQQAPKEADNSGSKLLHFLPQAQSSEHPSAKPQDVAAKKQTLMRVLQNITENKQKMAVKLKVHQEPQRLQKHEYSERIRKAHMPILDEVDTNFLQRLKLYQLTINQTQCSHLFITKTQPARQALYFIDDKYNDVVRAVMDRRWWWKEAGSSNEGVTFLWTQGGNVTFMQKLERIQATEPNQIEHSRILDFLDETQDQQSIKEQKGHKITLLPSFAKIHNHIGHLAHINDRKTQLKLLTKYFISQGRNVFDQIPFSLHVTCLSDAHFTIFLKKHKKSEESWVVKPGESSHRAHGHRLCSNTKQLLEHVSAQLTVPNRPFRSFIVQKYIKPFLYQKRKFDIRCFILIANLNNVSRVYFYQEGYARVSTEVYNGFDTSSKIHFTNDWIQRQTDNYGLYEHKLSFSKLAAHLQQFNVNWQFDIVPKLMNMALDCYFAVKQHITMYNNVFSLVQMDFLLDNNLKVWLLDMSTDLEMEIPMIGQVLDDTLRLTIDPIYPPPSFWPKEHQKKLGHEKNCFVPIYDSKYNDHF